MMCVEAKGCCLWQGIFVEYVQFQIGRNAPSPLVFREFLREEPPEIPFGVILKRPVRCINRSEVFKEENMAKNEKIRVKLKSYDHALIDAAAAKIVEVAKRSGCAVSGPIPLPTDTEKYTILRAVHKYKDSREQFEFRTHKRLIDIIKPSQKTIDALMSIELPAGVDIEVKM